MSIKCILITIILLLLANISSAQKCLEMKDTIYWDKDSTIIVNEDVYALGSIKNSIGDAFFFKPKPPVGFENQFTNGSISLKVTPSKSMFYKWERGNDEREGPFAEFDQTSGDDYFNLTITNPQGCKREVTYKVDSPNITFGTVDDHSIPEDFARELTRPVSLYECDIKGNLRGNSLIGIVGTKFMIVGKKGNNFIIKFYKWNEQFNDSIKIEKRVQLNNNYVYKIRATDSTISQQKFFLLREMNVKSSTIPFKWNSGVSFTAATVLIPVKLRWNRKFDTVDNGFEFSKDVGLGAFVGAKKKVSYYNPHFISLGFATGISSVTLNPRNSSLERVQEFAAFTLSVGVVLEFDNIQIGGFLGQDRINNNFDLVGSRGNNWVYHKKSWISIGIGYSLLSRPSRSFSSRKVHEQKNMKKEKP